MRIAVCGTVAVISTFLAVPALAQAPRPAPVAPAYGPPPPGYGPPPPGYGPPPPGYGPPPPGYYAPPESQERTAMNGLYVEGFGPGLFYSFNYDRVISDIALRIGIGYITLGVSNLNGTQRTNTYVWTLPFDINYIGIGSKKHIFELGAGATVIGIGPGASTLGGLETTNDSKTFIYGHLNIGYRLQPPSGGFMLRTGISPLIGAGGFLPWPYIALGATF
jgi:hypothetical protein